MFEVDYKDWKLKIITAQNYQVAM